MPVFPFGSLDVEGPSATATPLVMHNLSQCGNAIIACQAQHLSCKALLNMGVWHLTGDAMYYTNADL